MKWLLSNLVQLFFSFLVFRNKLFKKPSFRKEKWCFSNKKQSMVSKGISIKRVGRMVFKPGPFKKPIKGEIQDF